MSSVHSIGRSEGGKAHRVYLLLRDEILRGDYPAGSLLPGELKLAERHGVSRVTIRRALESLANDGLIDRRAGAGTRVSDGSSTRSSIAADFASLMPQVVQMGQDTTARLLSYSYVTPSAAVADALGTSEKMQRAVRVRLLDGKPFSHLTTLVPESLAQGFSEADLATTPLFRLLERSGVQVGHSHQTVSATLATPDVAEALELSTGSALLSLVRIVYDAEGRGIEHLSALYRPDRFQLEMTLNRVGRDGRHHWEPAMSSTAHAAE